MKQRHLINRTVLELDSGNLADVWSLQEEVSRVFQSSAVPELERLCDRVVESDQVIRLDQVVVDLGVIDRHFLAEEFVAKLLVILRQILQDAIQELPSQTVQRSSFGVVLRANRTGSDGEGLLYFLQYGRLPWWATTGSWQHWLARWETVLPTQGAALQSLLGNRPTAQQRLVEQFPESFRHRVLVAIQPTWTHWSTVLAQARYLMHTLGLHYTAVQTLEQQAWRSLFAELRPEPMPFPAARWMRHWLEPLVAAYTQSIASDILKQHPDFVHQRLHSILTTVAVTERTLWLTTLDQVAPSIDQPALQSDLELWLYFLQHGRFPIAQVDLDWQTWLSRWQAVLQSQTNWRTALQSVLMIHEIARQRLIEQFPISFRRQLVDGVASPTEQALWSTLVDPPPETRAYSDLEVWLYFLQQGRLPPGAFPQDWSDWLSRWQAVMQSQKMNWRLSLQVVLTTNPMARQRLVEQFPLEFRQQLVDKLLELGTPRFASQSSEGSQWLALVDPSQALEPVYSDLEVWLYFLQQGHFPPGQSLQTWQDWLSRWEAVIHSQTNWWQSLQAVLTTNSIAQQRLVEQFPLEFRQQLVDKLLKLGILRSQWSDLVDPSQALEPVYSDLEVWLYFLQQGHFPPGQSSQTWQDWLSRWEAVIHSQTNWWQSLQVVLTTNSIAQQRLIDEFPEAFRQQLIVELRSRLEPVSAEARSPLSDLEILLQYLEPTETTEETQAIERTETRPLNPLVLGDFEVRSTGDPDTGSPQPLNPKGANSDLAVWLYFLEQGHLPPGQIAQDWLSRWQAVMQSEIDWQTPVRNRLTNSLAARQRLVIQFPESFRHQLIVQMQPLWSGWYALFDQAQHWMQTMNLSSTAVQQLGTQAWLLLLSELISQSDRLSSFPIKNWIRNWLAQVVRVTLNSSTADSIQHLRTSLAATEMEDLTVWLTEFDRAISAERNSEGTLQSSIRTEVIDLFTVAQSDRSLSRSKSPLLPEEEAAGLYVTQAGLVLLHPFLSFYFDALGLLEGDSFRDTTSQQMAVYLLHYLATKQTDVPEYELVFPKLLCGWSLDEPVVRGVELSIAALQESETLLQTVINYWEVLKSTSPDGLREGFLQRQGKLTRNHDGNWKLQVERSAIDVLLGSLPWGLSMVKLPWMDHLLVVEWH